MTETIATPEAAWYRTYGWGIPFALGALLGLFGLAVIFMGADPDDFESSTGISWEALNSSSPEVARYVDRLERLVGVLTFGFGSSTAIVAYAYLKKGDRTAWRAIWLVPIVLGIAAAVFFLSEAAGLGGLYVGAVLIALIGQLLSYPRQ